MGKVDQGLVTLWVAKHFFQRDLAYFGYGGSGKQVRDLLHVADLFELLSLQLERPELWDGTAYNVGGGLETSVSLLELTELCRELTGRQVPIHSREESSPADIRLYVTDHGRASTAFGWRPRHSVRDIIADVRDWVQSHESDLRDILA